jgi:predicted MPP superfamily phosphohydrolase
VASDLVLWTAGGAARAETGVPGEGAAAFRAALALAITGAAIAAGLRSGLAPPALRREEFAVERWPRALDGFRIVQISDIHIGPLLGREFAAHLAQRVNALAPDLIAVTGDLVDGSAPRLAAEVAPFADLRARCGVYFVTGNHDHYSGAAHWSEAVSRLGMRVLRNERVEIGTNGASFDLVGVDDHHAHFAGDGREDLARALAGRDPERPAVLLAHDPATFTRARGQAIDLQLSGHTHGGQIWPFAWFVRLATRYVAGRYRHGRAQLYVSRGTGFWGPPLRLFSPAEITEITIRSEQSVRAGL